MDATEILKLAAPALLVAGGVLVRVQQIARRQEAEAAKLEAHLIEAAAGFQRLDAHDKAIDGVRSDLKAFASEIADRFDRQSAELRAIGQGMRDALAEKAELIALRIERRLGTRDEG